MLKSAHVYYRDYKETLKMRKYFAVAAAAAMVPLAAYATPYASNVQVSGTTGSFILNESADSVTITYGDNSTQIITPTAGSHNFTLPSAGSTFKISVSKNSGAGYLTQGTGAGTSTFATGTKLQISSDSNSNVAFTQGRGIAVNTDPNSGVFGRVYVASASGSTSGGVGMYALNADFSGALSAGSRGASNGGIAWTAGGSSPYRIQVGQDNNVYITDFADAHANLFRLGPNLTASVGTVVFEGTSTTGAIPEGQNHGNAVGLIVSGTEANNNLKVITLDEDYINPSTGHVQNVLQYNIGGPIPATGYNGTPTVLVDQPSINYASVDLATTKNGNIYLSQNRANSDVFSLKIYDPSGNELYDSLTASGAEQSPAPAQDFLRGSWSMAISPDDRYIALGNVNGSIKIVPLDANGIPIFSEGTVIQAFTSGTSSTNRLREVAFDVAGNLYAIQDLDAKLRVFSPGGLTTMTTGFDGTGYYFDVPEPTSLAAFSLAGALLLQRRRRSRS
jgi:hypothetical protein